MRDLDIARSILKTKDCTLVIVKNGVVVFKTDLPGVRGLLMAIEENEKDLKHSAVADKVVGEAAAKLCAYVNVSDVFAITLSQCGKEVLEENNIRYEYENLVPHILNFSRTDLCPFEKLVSGSNPAEALEKLRESMHLSPK